MILTGKKIVKEIKEGTITIDPFDPSMINPNSYNYRLGKEIFEVTDEVIDSREPTRLKKHVIDEEGFILKPNTLYLASTKEKIGSSAYVTSLIGRSSIGRLGLFVQITADMGNLGSAHSWTLEIKVVQKIKVYPNMKIGQVSFWKCDGPVKALYREGYTATSKPKRSNFHKELGLEK